MLPRVWTFKCCSSVPASVRCNTVEKVVKHMHGESRKLSFFFISPISEWLRWTHFFPLPHGGEEAASPQQQRQSKAFLLLKTTSLNSPAWLMLKNKFQIRRLPDLFASSPLCRSSRLQPHCTQTSLWGRNLTPRLLCDGVCNPSVWARIEFKASALHLNVYPAHVSCMIGSFHPGSVGVSLYLLHDQRELLCIAFVFLNLPSI